MTPQQYLEAIRNDSDTIAAIAADHLDHDIAFIEGWDVRQLVSHLGAVYAYATANTVQSASEVQSPGEEAKAPAGDAILGWFSERQAVLLDTLSNLDINAPSVSHAGSHPAGWWQRRMAQETTVHRWDAAAGVAGTADAPPIPSDLAADGIEEYIEVSLRFTAKRLYPAESLHLHRTDGTGEWMLVGDGKGGVIATHEHGKGDAAVRGSASALMLWMWGRPVGTTVEVFGDESVANAWHSLAG